MQNIEWKAERERDRQREGTNSKPDEKPTKHVKYVSLFFFRQLNVVGKNNGFYQNACYHFDVDRIVYLLCNLATYLCYIFFVQTFGKPQFIIPMQFFM